MGPKNNPPVSQTRLKPSCFSWKKLALTDLKIHQCLCFCLKMHTSNVFFLRHIYKKLLKGRVHPKIKILSSFTRPQVVPNLYECLCSAEHKGRYFWRKFVTSCLGHHWLPIVGKKNTMEVNGAPRTALFPTFFRISSFVFSRTRHSYRFGTTWGRVNDDRIFIFGWTIPLNWTMA